MFSSDLPDTELLKSLLEPLLEDFQYWFERSRHMLETQTIPFLALEQQTDLLARVLTSQQEVATAQMLFRVTQGQAGIETSVLATWHQLVTECWHVATRLRMEQSTEKGI
mgnify:CR=1 FL=1